MRADGPPRQPSPPGLIAFLHVTRQKEIENRSRAAQKLEALGTFAGGIAHEFNSILYVIMGFAEPALLEPNGDVELRERLEKILQASERARELVRQILAFRRKETERRERIDLARAVHEGVALLRGALPKGVENRSRGFDPAFPHRVA